jgi:hypothetical protein
LPDEVTHRVFGNCFEWSVFNSVRRSLTYGLAIFSGEVTSMNRRLVCCLFLLGNMLLVSISDSAEEAPKTKKPNIVLIISDDLSWGDLGCYGQKQILTPNIDRLANEGMRFTNAYAGNSVCAPSRSCLMQGLHPGHARVRGNAYKGYREGLAKDDVTVAEILKGAGTQPGCSASGGLV